MRFEHEGKHYGLRIPVWWEAFRHGGSYAEVLDDGEQMIVMSDDGARFLISMLQDLRHSYAESQRLLREGKQLIETPDIRDPDLVDLGLTPAPTDTPRP